MTVSHVSRICLATICFYILSSLHLSSARPHVNFNKHSAAIERRHQPGHPTVSNFQSQIPLIEIDSIPGDPSPPSNASVPMISLSFQSIAQWPKSGEEIDFVTVPLGRWITPEQVSSLPSRPHKAHFISARYQADSNGPARPYEHQDDITCHMIVKDDESDSGPGSLREFARPLSFKFADGEVNFEDPVGPWYLAGISISSFGCI